jgi:hypothetical protein
MKNTLFALLSLTFLLNSNPTFSDTNEKRIDGDLEISHYEITEIPVNKSETTALNPQKDILQEVVYVVDTLIAVGKKIYEVVDAGRPVVNAKFNNISVLPKGESGEFVNAFYDMEGWSAPAHKKYKISFKNIYGIEVVSFVYGVSMQYGGKYNGAGSYILGANIYPDQLDVFWGFNFDASVETVSISNTSSLSDPVATVQLRLDGKVASPIVESKFSHVFYLTGDGKIKSNK